MEEHGVLKRVLLIYQAALDRIEAGEVPPASAIHAGALVIHDFIEGFHEGLEEGYVFPRLRQAGQVTGTVNNFRFNESPVGMLGRLLEVGSTVPTLPREWGDYFNRAAMPPVRVEGFNMSSVSQAS